MCAHVARDVRRIINDKLKRQIFKPQPSVSVWFVIDRYHAMERAELTAVEQCGCVSSAHASGSQPSDSPPNPALHYAHFAAHVPRRFLPYVAASDSRYVYAYRELCNVGEVVLVHFLVKITRFQVIAYVSIIRAVMIYK